MKLQIFTIKEISEVESNHTCSAVTTLDSALKKNDNHYPKVLLKECKYTEKKVVRVIINDLSDLIVS